MPLPFSQACENNKQPILDILEAEFSGCCHIVEIGSGTGQHAVFFAEKMPWLIWQPTDQSEYLAGINAWLHQARLSNLRTPVELDVTQKPWPQFTETDGIFSANTCHIMHWPMVEDFISGVGKLLGKNGKFCLYGPFNYHGNFTSESNEHFDQWLKQRDPLSGIRDQEAILILAKNAGLELIADHAMPANNRLLVFSRN
jgi:cyclopropane fatty-acyl-phospholipid synthase-like methyltransferase